MGEGWRMSALLLDQSTPSFSWRRCVLAFIQADIHHRGWLDPHEVRDSEAERVQLPKSAGDQDGLNVLDKTSLGAYAFRSFHRCSAGGTGNSAPETISMSTALVLSKNQAQKDANEACLQVNQVAFESLQKTLGVYLTWLMHSENLSDLAVYHSVKAQIYGFRQAASGSDATSGTHHLRCLLLLLLAHQFDVQLQRGGVVADHLNWELESLLRVLRESWKRGAGIVAEAEMDLTAE